jgi:hypothetical protein
MALVPLTLDIVASILRNVEATGCSSRRVASLGYPDILAGEEHIREIFGNEIARQIEYRPDSASVLRWHHVDHRFDRVPDAASLFRTLGWDMEVVDIVAARGGEILQDLNTPVADRLKLRYAAVIDAGTLEHCFNIAQAACNIAEMVAVGGAVMHGNPLNMYNHGFYNLNPTWYFDFYGENGFVVEYIRLVDSPGAAPRLAEVPPYQRFGGVPENSSLLVVARRDDLCEIRWPVQRKYRDNPGLRG